MEKDSIESALYLAEKYKFSVFPIYGIKENHTPAGIILSCQCGSITCLKNAGKHPAISRGRNAASYSEDVIKNLWAARIGLNVAIATGIESGVFVIDVDGIIGEENITALQEKHGKLPKTLTSITGRGRHIIFRYPNRKVFSRTNVLAEKVDIRGDGGYIVAPNSRHISGVRYRWEDENSLIAEAPKWVLDVVCEEYKAPVVKHDLLTDSVTQEKWEDIDVRDMLSYVSADCDRDTWLHVGMAIQSGGFSFRLWDDWSRSAMHRYQGDTAAQWKSLSPDKGITMGTLVHLATLNGWKPRGFINESVTCLEDHPARDFLLSLTNEKAPEEAFLPMSEEVGRIPDVIIKRLPGVVGDTVRWICDVASKPQPELALLNTLASLGAIFGRKYALKKLNTRTNLYVVGLAPTGKGKDISRQKIKEIMNMCELGQYIGSDNLRSGPGLITSLTKQISQVLMIDEFGDFIDAIVDDNAPGHKVEISYQFTRLYSSSSSIYKEGSYADAKQKPIELHSPNLCIYGTTTEEMYAKSMRRTAIKSGALNRFIVVKGREKPELNHDVKDRDIPDDLLEQWKTFSNPCGGDLSILNDSKISPVITEVNYNEDVAERLKRIFIMEDNLGDDKAYGPLWARYRENTIKIAMIFAIARNPASPSMDDSDMDIAEAIVKTSVDYMVYLAREMMYENAYEKNSKDVYNSIRMRGPGGVSKTELTRLYRGLKKKELEDILSQLIDGEFIEAGRVTQGRKPTVIYTRKTVKREEMNEAVG